MCFCFVCHIHSIARVTLRSVWITLPKTDQISFDEHLCFLYYVDQADGHLLPLVVRLSAQEGFARCQLTSTQSPCPRDRAFFIYKFIQRSFLAKLRKWPTSLSRLFFAAKKDLVFHRDVVRSLTPRKGVGLPLSASKCSRVRSFYWCQSCRISLASCYI